jgi:non-specific serine/threonine protein kinase
MGKTRLAIELARENSSGFSAGVYFVTIGANAAPSAVLASLARQAGVTRVGEPISGLKAAFAGSSGSNPRTALILLDGCEHLTGNGEEIRRRLLVELPTVTIISTSRRTHVLPGEQCFSVLALESPTVDSVDGLENSSVQLFVERARKVSPHFTITGSNRRSVIEICRRLEGIPLSIELAAGRVNRSSPDSILRDLLERSGADEKSGWKEQRNRSFHTNLASSLSTLDGDFRTRFCSLAVFKNTFDAAAAQAVGGASREDLQRLTSLNLVTTVGELADMRFHLLDTVREFAWNELPKPLSRSISERHAVYYRHLVWSAERFHMSSGITRFPNLTVEDENIRQAFDWSLQSESAEIVGAYVLGLVWHWIYNGAQRQGREFVALARDRFRPNGLPGAQLDAAEGILASFSDDAETSRRCLTAALGFYETQTKSVYEIIVRSMLGYADYVAGEYESALHRVELNYARLVEAKYERALAGECHLMALCLAQFGRYQEAIEWNLRSLELWTAQGDLAYRGYAYLALGRTYWSSSDFESARNWYLKAITQFDELADARCFAYAVEGLGRISADEHHYADAGTLFGASQQVRDSIALGRDFADARDFDRSMHKVNAGLGDKAEAEWESGYGMSTKEITAWIRNRFVSSDSP